MKGDNVLISTSISRVCYSRFASLALVPDWYMYILVGMITVIYGMRGLLKMLLQTLSNRFSFKKEK